MAITAVRCPECGLDTKMGLPRGATVQAVQPTADADADADGGTVREDDRRKSRENRCENGHRFLVTFEL